MPAIRIQRALDVPGPLIFSALGDILHRIAVQDDQWKGFALHVDLGDAGLPNVGYLAFPIAVSAVKAGDDLAQYALRIEAAREPKTFPIFSGVAGVDVLGPGASSLWLEGTYETPGHIAGKVVDSTLLRGVAARALENFVDDMERACRAHVDKREAEYARSQRFTH